MPDISDLKLKPRQLTNVFAAVRPGRYMLGTALTAVTTFSGVTTLQAGDAFFWSLLIPNLGAAFQAKVSYAVLSAAGSDTLVDTTGLTWSAAETVNVAAGGTSAGLNGETVVFTQSAGIALKTLARTDSPTRARALVAWRVQMPSAVQPTVPNLGSYYWRLENNTWPMMKSTRQAVAGVDTPANFTTTAVTAENDGTLNPFYVGIKYTSSKFGKQILLNGDSIMEGLGGDPRFYGGVQRAACSISTPDAPIEWFNTAQHAQTPDTYSANMAQNYTLANPTIIVYAPYTINMITKSASSPGLTAAIKQECYRGMATLSRLVAAHSRQPQVFIAEPLPNALYDSSLGVGATTGAADVTGRQAFVTELDLYGSDPTPALTSGAILKRQGWTQIKVGTSWADPTLAAGGQQVPRADGLSSSDKTHPNEVGYETYFKPVYIPMLAAA